MDQTRLSSVRTLAPAHWLIVRRTFGGWLVEENIAGRVEALMDRPDLRREVVDLIADAYEATRTHHPRKANR